MTTHAKTKERVFVLAGLLLCAVSGCGERESKTIRNARAQLKRIAETLDRETTKAGVYVREKADDIKESDPWGTPIKIAYEQGGVAENVVVQSAGPDQKWGTPDDLSAYCVAMNFKGIGEGIKENAEEVAKQTAKGFVKGAVEGMKESLPRRKKEADEGEGKPSDSNPPDDASN